MTLDILSPEFKQFLTSVGQRFGLEGDIVEIKKFSSGHINDTLYVKYSTGNQFVFQAVNTYVFKKPVEVMENIVAVTEHIRNKYKAMGVDSSRLVLNFRSTVSGEYGFIDDDSRFWRVYDFIDGSCTYNVVEDPELLVGAGAALGEFQRMLDDFPVHTLHETIKDFHNTPWRFENLYEAIRLDEVGRVAAVKEELEYFNFWKEKVTRLLDLNKEGKLPLRVTHNDTKFNNVLIDSETKEPLSIIDLDTVMPGFSVIDFGDAIRTAAATAEEDVEDVSKMGVDIEMFEAFTKGFIGKNKGFFTPTEIDNMVWGAIIVTVELAARFFADYLAGDKYFKTAYPEHNLVRTRAQMKLSMDMYEKYDILDAIVKKYNV